MEGNACYKFSTIRNFIEKTGGRPIRLIVDVGLNVGDIAIMAKSYFPAAALYGFEAVREYYEIACARTQGLLNTHLFHRAITAQHLYRDDLGTSLRSTPVRLSVLKGLPAAGPGWLGGSMVIPSDNEIFTTAKPLGGYHNSGESPRGLSLDRLIAILLRKEHATEIDILKMDCEGCEHSSLGCASVETLRKIRFIVGEYHGIDRFYCVMRNKLFQTHKVNLIGQSDLGAFFAERLNKDGDGILKFNKAGMLCTRPWLSSTPLDWHLFNERYVLNEDRAWHALA